MKAWLLPGHTGIESLSLGEAPDPTPGPNQLVLDLKFAALNPADRYLSIGQYPAKPTFPHILGRDGVGTVTAVGEGVTTIRPGDTRLILRSDVGVNRPGTLAQKVLVDAAYTVEVPQGWSLEQAAAAPLVYVTAWQALSQWPDLPPVAPGFRPVILISGASGGVGVAATQLAHALGYTVIAISRSKEKSDRLRQLGADITLDAATPTTWRDQLKQFLSTQSSVLGTHHFAIDLAIDNIGGEPFNHLLHVMAPFGRISCVGRLAGPVPNFNTSSLFFRRLKIGGVAIGTYTNEESLAAWHNVLQTLSKTKATPLIDRIFPFEEVPAAFAHLHQGPMGKVIIRI